MPLPWEEYQQAPQQLPWQDFQASPTADADARAKAGIERAKALLAPGGTGPDPASVANVPAFSPAQYGQGGSAAMGAANSTTFGFGDELASYLGSGLTGVPRDQVLQEMRADDTKSQSDNPGSYLGGQVGGGLAQAVATGGAGMGPSVAKAGGSLFKTALGTMGDSALYGGALSSGNANGDLTDRLRSGVVGLGIGGLAGFAAPYLTAGASGLVTKAISPFTGSPEREAAAKLLAQEGVPVTAGQRTGNKTLRYAESELGGAKAANVIEQQGDAFTNAAMQKAGGAGRATSDNMAALADNLGGQFKALSARNSLKADRQIATDMNAANQEYARVLPAEQKKIFGALGDNIVEKFKAGKGVISGNDYQTIRSRLSRMSNNYRANDPEFSSAIRGLRDALDNGMDRSIRPEDAGAWALARKQYGNMKTLQNAIAGAGGEDAGAGVISPARLRMAASSGNKGAYAKGQGDFANLAKAGQAVMTPMPNSGTASRLSARNLGMFAPTVIGAGYGGASGGDMKSALAGAVAGYGLQKGAGMALMSDIGQRYLGNQAAKKGSQLLEARLASLLRSGLPALPYMGKN